MLILRVCEEWDDSAAVVGGETWHGMEVEVIAASARLIFAYNKFSNPRDGSSSL